VSPAHHCQAGATVGDHDKMEVQDMIERRLGDPNSFVKKQSRLSLETVFHTHTLIRNHHRRTRR
jgi:hypothetical protein